MSVHVHREGPEVVQIPLLKPKDVLTTLLSQDPWLLLGGEQPGPKAFDMLQTFWAAYRQQHPSHKVF